MKNTVPALMAAGLAAFVLAGCGSGGGSGDDTAQGPNILFVIMDDVGIDQMKVFGYGGAVGPDLPNIDAVAHAGVRFRNTWSMPECSPGRAAFFTGRYPHRTGIHQAIGPLDLANSQLSPYDATTPKLLKQAGYESAMFGKFHLAGPENNEAENATPAVLGWDHFYGWVGGLPGSIDSTAGGVDASGPYMCGFVPGVNLPPGENIGAQKGACYQPDGACQVMERTSPDQDPAGLQCLASGGVLVPGEQTCGTMPTNLTFDKLNGYYVSPLVIINNGDVEEVPLTDERARGYRTTIETDAAVEWINSRPANKPWMATVSYSAVHTPWQQPPRNLLAGHVGPLDHLSCTDGVGVRVIQDRMTEALDTEFGRLLVETGLASYNADGSLNYDPSASNTVIVIVGDNGSLATAVKLPFDFTRSKGSAYQTGVWDPLIIAGPQVVQPDREVDHMVNMVDVFQFFGELAGIDVHKEVPRTVDSVGILPYLKDPGQGSLRTINFTMGGMNIQADGGRNGPCILAESACTVIPTSKSVCEDNLGVWWGKDYNEGEGVIPTNPPGAGYETCADVNKAMFETHGTMYGLVPESSVAIRDDTYKLVRNSSRDYDPATKDFVTETVEELFVIDQAKPVPKLDREGESLLVGPGKAKDAESQEAYNYLRVMLDDMLASNPECPGDGNMDGVVDAEDLTQWRRIAHAWGESSVYDFVTGEHRDGKTNHLDEAVILAKLNTTCERTYSIY
ncbi:sulfatase-like hydrolase/transferase [Pusillimonas sp.]|uniref:sulfatase-like hydrolase/transferase n=1 Tax=Pusillimonas sp. TaxID=3040095 RepID=UPI0037CC3590